MYTQKILKCLSIDAANLLSSLMVVQSLDLQKDEFRSCNEGNTYLANCTRPDISFVINWRYLMFSNTTVLEWYQTNPTTPQGHGGFMNVL